MYPFSGNVGNLLKSIKWGLAFPENMTDNTGENKWKSKVKVSAASLLFAYVQILSLHLKERNCSKTIILIKSNCTIGTAIIFKRSMHKR